MNANVQPNPVYLSLMLLAELPLGIFYFTAATVGITLAVGLLPIWIGFPLLIGVLKMGGAALRFERARALAVLGESVPEAAPAAEEGAGRHKSGLLGSFADAMRSRDNWMGLLMMIVKLATGMVSFTLVVTLLSLPAAMIAYPIVRMILLQTISIDIFGDDLLTWLFNFGPVEASIVYFAVGIVLIRCLPAALRILSAVSVRITLGLTQV